MPISERWAWLVVTDEDRILEIRSDEAKARRTAKAIDGYLIKLEISEDYRPHRVENS